MLRRASPYQLRAGDQCLTLVPHQIEMFGGRVLLHVGAEQINLSAEDARLFASYLKCAANEADQLAVKKEPTKI